MAKKHGNRTVTTCSTGRSSTTLTHTASNSVSSNTVLPKILRPIPPTCRGHDANPLTRLSKQLNRTSTTLCSTYEPFKTLNTRSMLAPLSSKPVLNYPYSREPNRHHPSSGLNVCRTLPMPSEYETHISRMKKVMLNSRPCHFSDQLYSTQDWLHKDRGGPISRRYSEDPHSLLDRYKIRQKTSLAEEYTLSRVEKTLEYQQQCKAVLKDIL
ncbi:hypothetical protein EB796_003781 [Bugula neritina]|uniref:Uncharacterized protein n=1 Tax=Bugula neritina TaxID=10212 RepID=A0A7J7KFY6_BUGNE|nr:hypothetical protein EB796_004527 [Bugula neritina]KAF6037932.1 hypothetical protein EB796_003781 [Bugula neritina]